MIKEIAALTVAACLTPLVSAQSVKVDHFTQAQLLDKAQALSEKAKGPEGAASAKINEYPNHFTMISLRHKDGGAELHENFADFFFVVQGHATLLSGGTIKDAKTSATGETHGTAVLNGDKTPLGPGDVVHIPAGLSHQLLVEGSDTFVYFVIKVKEK